MFIRCDERNIAQLALEVDPQRFNTVPHGVSGSDSRQVHQELGESTLVGWLFEVRVVRVRVGSISLFSNSTGWQNLVATHHGLALVHQVTLVLYLRCVAFLDWVWVRSDFDLFVL